MGKPAPEKARGDSGDENWRRRRRCQVSSYTTTMTRWARSGPANKKQPLSGSSWKELTKDSTQQRPAPTQSDGQPASKRRKTAPRREDALRTPIAAGIAKIKATTKGLSEDDIHLLDDAAKKDQRREGRRLQRVDERAAGKVCYGCRRPGHALSDCPRLAADNQHAVDICFKCGSTEHSVAQCHVRVPEGTYPYAKCFICSELGHLSKQCPDNPRGLYPKGGCCRVCSSVEHYKKDCPELQKKQGVASVELNRLQPSHSADDEVGLQPKTRPRPKRTGPKIVKF